MLSIKNCTYGSSFKLTKNRNSVDKVINHLFAPGAAVEAGQNVTDNANDAIKARINVYDIFSYGAHSTPNMASDAKKSIAYAVNEWILTCSNYLLFQGIICYWDTKMSKNRLKM